MRAASTALINYLASSNQFVMAELYSIALANGGGTYSYTDGATDLVVSGTTYSSAGPLFERTSVRDTVGVEVDSLSVTCYPRSTDQIASVDFFTAARMGLFDGARFTLSKLIMPSYGDASLGAVVRFSGRIADLEFDRMSLKFTVRSDLELLTVQMPRNLYQSQCAHTLFDDGCALTKSGFGVNKTVTFQAADGGSFATSALAGGSGWADQGTVTFTSGAASGLSFSIRSSNGSTHTLLVGIPQTLHVGDTCTIYPGCDKTLATCSGKFSNLGHFRGFPYIPSPSTAL